jgi:hypothetical protein
MHSKAAWPGNLYQIAMGHAVGALAQCKRRAGCEPTPCPAGLM